MCCALAAVVWVMTSCVCSEKTFVTKEKYGNLEVTVAYVGGEPTQKYPEISVDGKFIGQISEHMPVLYLRNGEHLIEVRSSGFIPWQRKMFIAGGPNHQFIQAVLRREPSPTAPVPESKPVN
jgi:hypothetical protein